MIGFGIADSLSMYGKSLRNKPQAFLLKVSLVSDIYKNK